MSPNLLSVRAYRDTAARTASPGKITLMLFDGALRFLQAAAEGFEETHLIRRQEQINNNLLKANAILVELQTVLDMRAGGEFAERMFALYAYMQEQLHTANMQKQLPPIQVVQGLLSEIRDAWAEMLEGTIATGSLAA